MVREAHETVSKKGAKRVSAIIKIDNKRDIAGERMKSKLDSVLSKI